MKSNHQAGFTLMELLITLAVIGVVAAISLSSLSAQMQRSRLDNAALASGTLVRAAITTARRTSTNVNLNYANNVLRVEQGGVVTLRETIGAVTLRCRPPGDTGLPITTPCTWPVVFTAPYGSATQDFELVFTAGARTRTLQVTGPAGTVRVR